MVNYNERLVLEALSKGLKRSADEIALALNVPKPTVMSIAESLKQEGFLELFDEKTVSFISLTGEGLEYYEKGLPEARLMQLMKASGNSLPVEEIPRKALLSQKEQGIALSWIVKSGAARISKDSQRKSILHLTTHSPFPSERALKFIGRARITKSALTGEEALGADLLLQRGLAEEQEQKKVMLKISIKGLESLKHSKEAGELSSLTPEMLRAGSWKGKKFKEYDLKTILFPVQLGRKHPYNSFVSTVREKLVGMGFREVHGHLLELEFWDMDALYMPQNHPAREIHDIFKIKDPRLGELPEEIFQKVREAHRHGGKTGSRGWDYEMSREVSASVILRSHDTVISVRELAKTLHPPDRVFNISRVFRPDEIDWKHFIEFNQFGGFVADENTSFRELLGTLKTFAEEVFQARKVKFAPSYFPFTEPSVELHAEIPGKGWAEVGGAGMFRPELLSAVGVDFPVIAWGLGVDRLVLDKLGYKDIRQLFTHDIELLRKSKMV